MESVIVSNNPKDSTVDPTQTKLYQDVSDLSPELWLDLNKKESKSVAAGAGVHWDWDDGYRVPFIGETYMVNPEKKEIIAENGLDVPDYQTGLVLINYLVHASEEGLSGKMVSARDLNGGELFFQGPHTLRTGPVIRKYKRDGAALVKRAETMGGIPASGGDAAFKMLALPKVLISYTLFEEDDEFPAELTILFDSNTDKHLPLDSIWALVNVLTGRLAEVD